MAVNFEPSGKDLKLRFAQMMRADRPFNPVDGMDITGANVDRIQRARESFGWKDPRFVTQDQAKTNGWSVKPKAESVEMRVRNDETGLIESVALFNGENVRGMPSPEAMLAMSDAEIVNMREPAVDNGELSIAPVRTVQLAQPVAKQAEQADARPAGIAGQTTKPEASETPAPVAPGVLSGKLLSHGYAPYLNEASNKKSYFVSLADEHGEIETVWGVDLQRSIEESGVKIGDAITLKRNGHRAVEIEEKQSNGSFLKKSAERINWDTSLQPVLQAGAVEQKKDAPALAPSAAVEAAVPVAANAVEAEVTRFAVMAPYWQDGLHNAEGLALAKEINKVIEAKKLAADKEAIARLFSIHPKARQLGVEIVSEARYLSDPHLRANVAEPRTLLDGALVRDKEGAYRPAAGGMAVLQDKGDAVVLKSKTAQAYRGAMELALAKGWTAIELKGKPSMLADAWLEAKLLGLNVVNYSPSEKDIAKYTDRVAQESQRKGAEQARPMEQAPEVVEVRPFVDANGLAKTATVTYTVSYEGGKDATFTNPKDAAKAFQGLPAAAMPVVIRSVTRSDGVVRDEVVAGEAHGPGKAGVASSVERVLDEEFDEAMVEVIGEEKAVASLRPEHVVASEGNYVGAIVAIEGGRFAQKVGRDPDKVVWHELSKMKGAPPKVGEIAEIGYSKGVGVIKSKAQEQEMEGAGRGFER